MKKESPIKPLARDLPGLNLPLTDEQRAKLLMHPLGDIVGKDMDNPISREVWENIIRERYGKTSADNAP